MAHKPVTGELCQECGWEEVSDPSAHRQKCPECGAPFNNYWTERIYAYNSWNRPEESRNAINKDA